MTLQLLSLRAILVPMRIDLFFSIAKFIKVLQFCGTFFNGDIQVQTIGRIY